MNLLETALQMCPANHQFVILDKAAPERISGEREANVTYLPAPDLSQRSKRQIVKRARNILPASVRRGINVFRAPHRDRLPLQAAIRAVRPDIVWFMFPHPHPVDVPYISTVHDLEHRKQPGLPDITVAAWNWSIREAGYASVLPRATFVITGTEVGKEEIIRFYGIDPPNIRVIPFPAPQIDDAPPPDPRTLQKFGIKGPFLFYPAQFFPHKNHYHLLRALDVLAKQHDTRISLVLTGRERGNRQYVHEVAAGLGVSEQIIELGYVSRDEIRALYQNASALVFPTLWGPDNLPPLEAFAWRCPVAASDIPGAREQLGDGALFFRPTDPADMAAKIAQILTDDALRRRLIAAGAAIAAARTPQAYVGKIIGLLDEFEPIRRTWSAQGYEFVGG